MMNKEESYKDIFTKLFNKVTCYNCNKLKQENSVLISVLNEIKTSLKNHDITGLIEKIDKIETIDYTQMENDRQTLLVMFWEYIQFLETLDTKKVTTIRISKTQLTKYHNMYEDIENRGSTRKNN
jgi:hypothetical protein